MNKHSFKRDISKTSLLFISFSAIFGSGWLFAPFYAAQLAGPASLLAWILGALMSAVIGLTMAEVVTLFPETGGLNHIAKMTHGEFLSLLVTVLNLLVFILLPAIEVRAILQYCTAQFPFFETQNHEISAFGYLFALLLFILITGVNFYGAKMISTLTQFLVVFKVLTPILICVSFLYVLQSTHTLDHSRLSSFFPIPWEQVFQAIATTGIIFSFNGFNQATIFAGEAKNPQKAIPFAILGSLFFSGALYLVIQYVFLMAIPQESLLHGWSQLSFPGDQGPFAGMAILLGLSGLLMIIYADALISPLGTAFTYASSAPRLLYTLSEGHPFFSLLNKMNRHGVPFFSIGITFFLEILAFVFLPGLKIMISLLVAAFVLCYTVAPVSLMRLRKTHPTLARPFKIRFAPLLCYLSLFFSNLMVFSCGWMALKNLILTTFLLISVYLILGFPKKDVLIFQLKKSIWFLFQLCSLAIICYIEHIKLISFSSALIGIAITSLFSLLLSQNKLFFETVKN